MNGIWHKFNEKPVSLESENGHVGYTVPPRGSGLTGKLDWNVFAVAPDGFEWSTDSRYMDPTNYHGQWLPTGGLMGVNTIDHERNFKMRTNGSR